MLCVLHKSILFWKLNTSYCCRVFQQVLCSGSVRFDIEIESKNFSTFFHLPIGHVYVHAGCKFHSATRWPFYFSYGGQFFRTFALRTNASLNHDGCRNGLHVLQQQLTSSLSMSHRQNANYQNNNDYIWQSVTDQLITLVFLVWLLFNHPLPGIVAAFRLNWWNLQIPWWWQTLLPSKYLSYLRNSLLKVSWRSGSVWTEAANAALNRQEHNVREDKPKNEEENYFSENTTCYSSISLEQGDAAA